jgi:hypothetical protein
MEQSTEIFAGIDVSKARNAIAVATEGRTGEVRYVGEVDARTGAFLQLSATRDTPREQRFSNQGCILTTCKLNGVNPMAYMADILAKIVNGHLISQLDELLPWAYAQSAAALKDVAQKNTALTAHLASPAQHFLRLRA